MAFLSFFLFTGPAPPQIYTLSLHDALPISVTCPTGRRCTGGGCWKVASSASVSAPPPAISGCRRRSPSRRSEEHTSELQSLRHLVCRLLLEKKKKKKNKHKTQTRIVKYNDK